jgi:TusA-related sulfurtransferase
MKVASLELMSTRQIGSLMPDSQEPIVELFPPEQEIVEHSLDITGETCPMTFVRTRLALDRLPAGAKLMVVLRGAEPLANVPRTAMEQGHAVLSLTTDDAGISRLLLRKSGG